MGQILAYLRRRRWLKPAIPDEGPRADEGGGDAGDALPAETVDLTPPAEPSRRVLLVSDGSQGDVQPLVPLARRLQALGHVVSVATNADHLDFLQESGVRGLAAFPSKRAVFEKIKCTHRMFTNKARTQAVENQWLWMNPGALMPLHAAVQAFEPELIVSTHQAHQPLVAYAREFDVPIVVVWLLPSRVRRFIEGYDTFLNWTPPHPVLLATSPVVDNAAPHLALVPDVVQTGAWLEEEPSSCSGPTDPEERAALTKFLAEGQPPVAIGWGSMVLERLSSAGLLILVLRVLRRACRRAVVIGGWARLDALARDFLACGKDFEGADEIDDDELEELVEIARVKCCFVSSVPHSWLFPQCSCVVHHGGSGTTQAALRCGCPCVITPVWIDQFWWAATVSRLRVGVGFERTLEMLAFSPPIIAEAIKSAEDMAPNAEAIGAKLRAEDGVGCAVRELQRYLP